VNERSIWGFTRRTLLFGGPHCQENCFSFATATPLAGQARIAEVELDMLSSVRNRSATTIHTPNARALFLKATRCFFEGKNFKEHSARV
jgi:hypothetical protein